MRLSLLVLLAFSGCVRFRPATPDTGVPADTDTDADSDADTDSDTDTDTDNPYTDLPSWLTLAAVDRDLYADLDLEVLTFDVGPGSPSGYRDPDGNDPVFHVIKPATFTDPEAEHPVLMWLHGNAIGIEGDPDYGAHCGAAGIQPVVTAAIEEHAFIAAEVKNREWIWVVPENPWCDLWSGLGADDPVDPDHHGTEHVQTILDVLDSGFGDLHADPDRIYGWGTSIGGAGIVISSYGEGLPSRFSAVVEDSGPVGASTWYDTAAWTADLAHILGGPPYDDAGEPTTYYPNYTRVDATLLLREHDYRVPLFQYYNEFDGLVPARQNSVLGDALEEYYGAEGVRYFSHDVSHHAPGTLFHVQTGYERPPFSYANRAAFGFLEGKNVAYYEAESTCQEGSCTIEAESGTGQLEAVSPFSHGSAVKRGEADGQGVMYIGRLPDIIPAGVSPTVLPVLVLEDAEDAGSSDGIVTLDLKQDGNVLSSLTLRRSDFAAGDDETSATFYAQVGDTTWVLDQDDDGVADPLPEGTLTVQAFYQGRGTVWLDGFWFIW